MRVAAFTFGALLYEGSSTLVYAGVRDADGTPVVAKLVADGRRNLTHEFLVLEKVAGVGVVETLGLFEGSDGPVLVQRRFGTGSLADAARGERFAVARVLRIALQLAQVCARVHAARIVHRDIKPANILYDAASETIALADFGIAAELPVNARALPVGDFVGTPAYVSPEHTGRMAGGCDARSDLYSLGVTLYELLTGAPPFVERELLELIASHLSKAPEPPHKKVASIPPVVSDIVMKLLAKQPDERYQSARGLAADLERCLETLKPDGRGDGKVAAFELGRSDLLRPRFPQRLFGRADEIRTLEHAYARAANGAPQLVLISGREGAGRSELVRALARDLAIDSPLALGGWTAANDRPLAGLADALGTLANELLRLDEDRIAALRREFAARLGQIGQVIIQISPAMVDVFGPQPMLVPLTPEATRARLHHAFRCFASTLGDLAPLVLALRGFEHADPATKSLLEAILASPTRCPVLIVLIASEPAAFGSLRERAGAVSIELPALATAAVAEWVGATLECGPAASVELGEALHTKAAGNPLMLIRVLEHLVETGVIARREGRYVWSLDEVLAAPPPPTLGALAAQRIAELDDAARRVLAAVACSDEPSALAELAAMVATPVETVYDRVTALEHEGLVVGDAGNYRPAHPVIAQTALAALPADDIARMRGRLGAHLLAAIDPAQEPTGAAALRVAQALSRGTVDLDEAARLRAADLYVIAGEHVMASVAYDVAAALFDGAGALIGASDSDAASDIRRDLQLRIELGQIRVLMVTGRHAEANQLLEATSRRELSVHEIGLVYPVWCDNYSMMMDRIRALEVGLSGLDRLGIHLQLEPPKLRPLAAIRLNQRYLRRLTVDDHVRRPDATDPVAIAAVKILSTLTTPAVFAQRMGLYVMVTEVALSLILKHGHLRNTQGFMAVHACFLHAMRGDYAGARQIYEACVALEKARPSPELVARTSVVFNYMVGPWFASWQDTAAQLARAIREGVEVGDPVFAALCASASVTMLNLTGAPLDRLLSAVEGWGPFLRGDGGVAANAANIINIAGKLTRGEPLIQDDLDRVSNVPMAAGPMRNNAMVNLGLAIAAAGHERQVRAWLDEIRDRFPQVNFSQPHRMTLWLLDGLFAAKDARTGQPERRATAERIIGILRMLKRETQSTNNDPAIALLEAELARADGEIDRAAGLYRLAARDARSKELTPIVAYANEQRAEMLDEAGFTDEATLYYREAVIAYRRWSHMTKVAQLEQAHPSIRARDLARGDDARRTGGRIATIPTAATSSPSGGGTVGATVATSSGSVNDQLDLMTVLKVSQDISMQLTGSGVVRAVLSGIAQNAGAERVVFVLRSASGVETVHGQVSGGTYRDIEVALDDYAQLPKSVVRVARRTGRPLVVADALGDPGCSADPFVVESRCRSIAAIPVRRKGEVTGFVVLENRLVAGAFTPQLVSLTQALVAQAAISLDNASLYKNLEDRVSERTAALNARNAEMRMVLDHVAQGLVIVGRDGQLFAERSAVFASWFPDGVPATLSEFFRDDVGASAWFDIAWEQLVEGFLPLDLALFQLPKQLRRGERTLAFDWQPIVNDAGQLERVLVVLSDVTEALRRVEAERDQKQLMAIFERLSEDRNGVVEFLKETVTTVGELAAGAASAEAEKRLLHTLKGNSAVFGLAGLASRCHEIEDAMALASRRMTEQERAGLAEAWRALYDKLSRFIEVGDGFVQVRRPDYEQVLAMLRRDGHPAAHEVELWTLEPFRVRFQRIADQARALADRLGKDPIDVQIDHGGVHIDSETWAAFWSAFVHVVRNSIDHGLEEPAERGKLGKGVGTLSLRSFFRGSTLVFEFSDDGRGIAWDKLRDKARAAGLATETRKDLIAALFADGISTRSEASELSGRGVGLGALAAVCREMGCEISVDSTPGQGTTMRFELPGHLAKVRRERQASRELVVMPVPA